MPRIDIELAHFTQRLATYNPDALVEMKKSFGKELNIGNTFAAKSGYHRC
jgi:hypothetical protein